MSADRGSRTAQKETEAGERGKPRGGRSKTPSDRSRRPANVAPDAVKDPNEKTYGKPGLPQGREPSEGEVDPGAG